jgi:hypothetical protein
MPDWNLVTRAHVLSAIAEGERVGSRDFLARYGFRGVHAYHLWHRGEEFDASAILGVAYLQATGHAITRDELPAGEEGVAQVLARLGFDVVAEPQPIATPRTRTTAATPRRVTRPEPVLKICPTCQMALPATGVCDNCD